jgi:hypothetical protein
MYNHSIEIAEELGQMTIEASISIIRHYHCLGSRHKRRSSAVFCHSHLLMDDSSHESQETRSSRRSRDSSFLAGTTLMRLDLGTFTGFGYTNTAKGNKTERLGDYSTLGFLGL